MEQSPHIFNEDPHLVTITVLSQFHARAIELSTCYIRTVTYCRGPKQNAILIGYFGTDFITLSFGSTINLYPASFTFSANESTSSVSNAKWRIEPKRCSPSAFVKIFYFINFLIATHMSICFSSKSLVGYHF